MIVYNFLKKQNIPSPGRACGASWHILVHHQVYPLQESAWLEKSIKKQGNDIYFYYHILTDEEQTPLTINSP